MTTQLLLKLYKLYGSDGQAAVVYATSSDEAITICETEAAFYPVVIDNVPFERALVLAGQGNDVTNGGEPTGGRVP